MAFNKKKVCIYALIMMIQVLVVIYWANQKTNYHVDELYSMGYASSFTGMGDRALYITTSPEFEFDKWIINADLKKYLSVEDSERLFNAPISIIAHQFVLGRNYFGLLNIAESVSGYLGTEGSAGVVLNILFYLIAEIEVISLMKKLGIDERICVLSVIMFGFSGYMISMVEYIRFYMLIILFMLLILNCLYRLLITEKWHAIIGLEAIIMLLAYLSFRDSEFIMPFFGSLMLGYLFVLVLRKKRKQLISLASFCVLGFLYILITTDLVGILFNPGNHSVAERGIYVEASQKLREVSFGSLKEYGIWLKSLLEAQYFGKPSIIYTLLGTLLICLILMAHRHNTKEQLRSDFTRLSPTTIGALVIWAGILGVSVLWGHGRFICVLFLYLFIIIGTLEIVGFKWQLKPIKSINPSLETLFIAALLFETAAYTLFDAMCQYEIWRYYVYGFVSVSICFWFVIDRLIKLLPIQQSKRPIMVILGIYVIVVSLMPFSTRSVENMYEDERTFVEKVRSYGNIDVVLVSEIEDGVISRHETYDCVNLIPDNARIYVTDLAEYEYSSMEYPEEFLLWTYGERDISGVLRDLRSNGYEIEDIGADHCSKAYVVRGNTKG